jgi:hypothetical protein
VRTLPLFTVLSDNISERHDDSGKLRDLLLATEQTFSDSSTILPGPFFDTPQHTALTFNSPAVGRRAATFSVSAGAGAGAEVVEYATANVSSPASPAPMLEFKPKQRSLQAFRRSKESVEDDLESSSEEQSGGVAPRLSVSADDAMTRRAATAVLKMPPGEFGSASNTATVIKMSPAGFGSLRPPPPAFSPAHLGGGTPVASPSLSRHRVFGAVGSGTRSRANTSEAPPLLHRNSPAVTRVLRYGFARHAPPSTCLTILSRQQGGRV